MDGGCTVTFGGTYGGTYYLPCNAVNDFDDSLVFYGDTAIFISDNINKQGNRLICQPNCTPAYVNSNEQYVYITPTDVTWNDRSLFYREYDIIMVFCLITILVLRFVTIFRR